MIERNSSHQFLTRTFIVLLLAAACVVSAAPRSSPSPIFVNDDPVTPPDVPPQVDALIFANNSLFVVSNNFLLTPLTPLPYSALSVQFWTNQGTMIGLPGFRFDNTPNPAHMTASQRKRRGANLPRPSQIFFNEGEITASDSLLIHANQIYNPGLIAGDVRARIRLNATNGLADLSRGAVHSGGLPIASCVNVSNFFFGPFFFGFDPTVNYLYLDSGLSGFVDTNRSPLFLPSLAFTNFGGGNFTPPNPFPPSAQYRQSFSIYPGAPATNLVTNILFNLQSCGLYDAFVHLRTNTTFFTNVFSNQVFSSISRDVSVVFVPTNGLGTNISVGVAFPTNQFGTLPPIVEFRAPAFDVIEQQVVTNYITFRNDGAAIFRGHDCQFDLSDPPNAPYAGDLFYNTSFTTNFANYFYTVAYAQVGNTNSIYFTNAATASPQFLIFPELGRSPAASDPTNFNGSVIIEAKDLDLTRARIRAENGVHIRTTNLIGNDFAFIDAPFMTLDAATTNASLVLSNLIRPQSQRMQATLNSWAANWTVFSTNGFIPIVTINTNGMLVTNFFPIIEPVNFQVLILGACVDTFHPAITHRLTLHATNIVIEDNVLINSGLLLNGQSLTLGSNASLALPRGHNLAFTNLVGITSFTNEGIVNVPDGAFFGAFEDGYVQPPPTRKERRQIRRGKLFRPVLETYESFVNHDTVQAASFSARAGYIEHLGLPFSPALIAATNGSARLDGTTVIISNATITASSDIRINAADLLIARSTLLAGTTNGGRFSNTFSPGAIIIDATNSFTDGGLSASNDWRVTAGVSLARRPRALDDSPVGDLMGTRIVVRSGTFAASTIQWAGEDRGPFVEGFQNNLALGRLVLDGAAGNLFGFRSSEGTNALYVDYLELLNDATNYNFALGVDPDFTVYFADANISPEKLEDVSGGRLRWVFQFTGPQSSTNITYPNGFTYTFNAGVVRSKDRDDDGDGVVNGEDCTPLPVAGFDSTQPCVFPDLAKAVSLSTQNIGLTITLASGGREVVLSWDATAGSANTVEFMDSLAGGAWQVLTSFSNGPENARVTVKDAVAAPLRVYRVRVDAGKP